MTSELSMQPGSPLRMLVHTDESRSVVSPQGELDMSTVPRLEAGLLGLLAQGETVLDLSGVSFIDSSGIALLMSVSKTAREHGWRLQLQSPSAPVARLIELTGVAPLLGSPEE